MERDIKIRRGTLADLRGILSDYIASQPTDEELRRWIDEARSRNLPESLKKQIGDAGKIQDTRE